MQQRAERKGSLFMGGKCRNAEKKDTCQYLNKLEEAISESSLSKTIRKSFHLVSMKFKDREMEAKVTVASQLGWNQTVSFPGPTLVARRWSWSVKNHT